MSSASARSNSTRLNGLASTRAAPSARAASASRPCPELNRPEIAMTAILGHRRFTSEMTAAPLITGM
jgi:hypothetical protein